MEKTSEHQPIRSNRRNVQASTTLSRKYARRPRLGGEISRVSVERSPEIQHFHQFEQMEEANLGQMEDLFVTEPTVPEDNNVAINFSHDDPIEKVAAKIVASAMNEPVKVTRTINVLDNNASEPAPAGRDFRMSRPRMDGFVSAPTMHHSPTISYATPIAAPRVVSTAPKAPVVPPKTSAKELKDIAIKKALASANKVAEVPASKKAGKMAKTLKKTERKTPKKTMHFGFGRVMLALSCAAAAVAAIVYFVNLNMPDISLRVAAMQTGIDPTYPTYVPRNYSVSGITSREGEIKIDFVNTVEGKKFSLTEEKSSWDTNALLSNFVKSEYGEDYTIIREQGLTIYVSDSNAAWVNGGNVYKISASNGTLTNKQIKSIAVSL